MRIDRLYLLACVVVVALLLIPSGSLASPQKRTHDKEWTILLYWCADNNLEFVAEFNIATVEKALTSNDHVNFIVLLDTYTAPGIILYEIVDGQRKTICTWEEKNTSDPLVLEEFILFGMKNFPARKTMLIMNSHGYGWRGICEDFTNGDLLMPIDGLADALKDARSVNRGTGIDLLAFDSCNMASIEVVYELRDAVPYVVGTESVEPYDGLPYELFVTDLVNGPTMSPLELAAGLTDDYVLYYSSKKDYDHIFNCCQDFATMASFDMSRVSALGEAFVRVTSVLEGLLPAHARELEEARGYAFQGTWNNVVAGYEWMPDVYTLFDLMKGVSVDLDTAIHAFEQAFNEAVVAEAHSKRLGESPHGLNIWFPPSLFHYDPEPWPWLSQFVYHEVGLDLVAESHWVDCLMAYYAS
jgi:hypothetical protein